MPTAGNWQPVASKDAIMQRARMLKSIRAFFDDRGVLEVETPLLASAGSTDPNINSLQTRVSQQPYYLNTSPEYCMKRLLAENPEPIYQVCRVFRDDELGPNHNPEFSMLEWYRPGFDMFQLMDEIETLLACVFEPQTVAVKHLSYREAFVQFAGIDPHVATASECRHAATEHNIEQPVGLEDDKDEWLDWLLTQLVMPSLEREQFTFIYNYPASQCALARLHTDEEGMQVASRFELFYGELELANGFHELQSATEQKQRFLQENQRRKLTGKPEVVIDKYLIDALESGLPDCAGVALGLDRLLMLLCNKQTIDEVLAFPFSIV